jgi:hypothetical protein
MVRGRSERLLARAAASTRMKARGPALLPIVVSPRLASGTAQTTCPILFTDRLQPRQVRAVVEHWLKDRSQKRSAAMFLKGRSG